MSNFNFNYAYLGGRLTADPELRQTTSGKPVCKFTVAVNRPSSDGSKVADFVSCIAWESRAEFITRYFRKGSPIFVGGEIITGSYDKNGQKVYTTDINVREVKFVDSASEADTGKAQYAAPAAAPQNPYVSDGAIPVDDDDLPF